jgi:hypothetical protein
MAMAAESLDPERILPWTAAESIPTRFLWNARPFLMGKTAHLARRKQLTEPAFRRDPVQLYDYDKGCCCLIGRRRS